MNQETKQEHKPITFEDLKAFLDARNAQWAGRMTDEQHAIIERLAPVDMLATAIGLIEQAQATIDTLKAQLGDAQELYEVARKSDAEIRTAWKNACSQLTREISDREKSESDWIDANADLRRQLGEAQTENLGLSALIKPTTRAIEIEHLTADNAALVAVLDTTLDNYAPMGGNGRTCEECDGFDSHIEGCRMFHVAEALCQPHPGAPVLAELAALRNVEEERKLLWSVFSCARVLAEYLEDEPHEVMMLADAEILEGLNNAINAMLAIDDLRNREGR